MATINTINGNILTTGALNIFASSSVVLAASSSNTLKVDGASLVYLTASKVGISNTNPLYSLDVSGSINTNASIFAANTISASAMSASNFYGTSSWSTNALTASYLPVNTYNITSSWAQTASNALFSQTSSYLTGGNVIANNISSSGTLFVQGNTTLAGNLTVLGTSSVITVSSSVIIGGNKVTVNAYSPFMRYAGLSAYDSGSANNYSSSILWDSLNNAWIIQGTGELTDAGITSSAVLIGGPISNLGSETVLTVNTIPKAQTGGVNLTNSLLTDNGTTLAYTGAGGISSSVITASTHIGSAFSSSATNAVGFYGTSSWSVTSSYSLNSTSASYAPLVTGATYTITASWAQSASNAVNSQTASYLVPTNSYTVTNLNANGYVSASSITASTHIGAAYSSSATNAVGFYGTSSWSVTASYALGSLAGGTTNYIPVWTSAATLSASSIYQSGSNVAINNTTFNSTAPEALLVSGSSYNVISGYGNLNNYLQLNIKNSNIGSSASSDIVATADNGTEAQYYVDLGINSSVHVPNGDVGQANDGYLYNTGSNFYIGNTTPNKNLYFFAGSPIVTSSMVLTSTSNLGIGVTSPVNKLDVGGNISASAITASTFTGTYFSSSTTNAVGYFGTSSYANNATSASYALTASYSIASANAFLQGGNSFAQAASLGTNDNNNLIIETNNITRLVVDTNNNLTSSVNFIPSADNTYNLGSSAFRFTGIYAAQSTIGALFETGLTSVGISSLATGTVLIWKNGKLIPCETSFDEMVMGVVETGRDEPIVFGAEPVLVTGIVNEGDYIVTSDKQGHGMGVPRGSVHPNDLFAKVIAQAVDSGNGESYTIKAMIRKM